MTHELCCPYMVGSLHSRCPLCSKSQTSASVRSRSEECQTRTYWITIPHASRGLTWHSLFKNAAKFCLFWGELRCFRNLNWPISRSPIAPAKLRRPFSSTMRHYAKLLRAMLTALLVVVMARAASQRRGKMLSLHSGEATTQLHCGFFARWLIKALPKHRSVLEPCTVRRPRCAAGLR